MPTASMRRVVARGPVGALALLALLAAVSPAAAQGEICGDGTTFTVTLPSLQTPGASDSVTLPDGCRVYALFVSGYERNKNLDEATFYNLAKFIMENDGYVHWAWWNNLLKSYMAGPLHPYDTLSIPILGEFGPSPGGLLGVHALGFAPFELPGGLAKAVPGEDYQFQSDARRLLQEIRARNPNAIIVVAGHSMGGNSVARLGANTPVDIDLLAPIDPVGNRSDPVGRFNPLNQTWDQTYNWTRWRATREWRGFRRADCVRNSLGLCQNFGTIFRPSFHCTATGTFQSWPLIPGSWAPIVCPFPVPDTGIPLVFSGRVKRLYHRWQKETAFPFDYSADVYFGHWAPRNAGSLTEARNIQRPVLRNGVGESDPNKTCGAILDPLARDPRDPLRLCSLIDGHGEIIGFRFPTIGQPNPDGPNVPVAPLANQLLGLSPGTDRRQVLLEMRTADESWSFRPINPGLDMVSADMVTIVDHLLSLQPAPSTPPAITSSLFPAANEHGWHNEDVVVTLSATDGSAPLEAIEFTMSGAQTQGTTTHTSNALDIVVSTEGETVITFIARDTAGNVSEAGEITVRLDKTPPSVIASLSPEPNLHGWNRGDVTVSFVAEDTLSGLLSVDPAVTLTEEGAAQEVVGTATDLAGNTSAAVVAVNIDRTPPVLQGLPTSACIVWPPNRQLVHVATVVASDDLSGIAPDGFLVVGSSNEPEIGTRPGDRYAPDVAISGGIVQLRAEFSGVIPSRIYSLTATAGDLAGNEARQTASCFVTKPLTLTVPKSK